MVGLKINVQFYAGSRGDESPRRVMIGETAHDVLRVLDRAMVQDSQSRTELRRFRVLLDDGRVIDLSRAPTGEWYAEEVETP